MVGKREGAVSFVGGKWPHSKIGEIGSSRGERGKAGQLKLCSLEKKCWVRGGKKKTPNQ